MVLMKNNVFSIAEKFYESKKILGNKWALNITRVILFNLNFKKFRIFLIRKINKLLKCVKNA